MLSCELKERGVQPFAIENAPPQQAAISRLISADDTMGQPDSRRRSPWLRSFNAIDTSRWIHPAVINHRCSERDEIPGRAIPIAQRTGWVWDETSLMRVNSDGIRVL